MRPKSLHSATFTFPLGDAPYLPLTGELHPLRREASRWVLWGNAIALSFAILAVALGGPRWRDAPQDRLPSPGEPVRIEGLLPPPSILEPPGPRIRVPVGALPRFGVPEPVPTTPDLRTDFATVADLLDRASALDQIDLLGEGSTIVLDLPEASPEPVPPTVVEELPRLLRIEPPVYPSLAREAGIEGTITLRLLVGKDGRVKQCVFVEGNSLLKDAAIASAWAARFSPAMHHNEPVEVWVQIPIQFSLK